MRAKPQSGSGRNLRKGLLAGALGGLIGSLLMSELHSLLQTSESNGEPGKEDSTVLAAAAVSRLFHHELTPYEKWIAGPVVHYLFGTTMGAAYGVLVEFWSVARIGGGLPFGAVVWLGAHVITVPALGLSEPITHSAPGTEAVEGTAHLVYGAVVEGVRRLMRQTPASRNM